MTSDMEKVLSMLMEGPVTNREFMAAGIHGFSEAVRRLRGMNYRIDRTTDGAGIFIYELRRRG